MSPDRSEPIAVAAHRFCREKCRKSDGTCPLELTEAGRDACPLWLFVKAQPLAPLGPPASPRAVPSQGITEVAAYSVVLHEALKLAYRDE